MENDAEKKDYILPAAIVIAAILVAGALVYSNGLKNTKPETQTANVGQADQSAQKITSPQIGGAAVLGDEKAPITIFIFSDYQCPYCGKFYTESELLIRKNYVDTGEAKMVYKNLIILGPESVSVANAAECAKDQNKFWNYHDAIFDIEIKESQTKGNSENTGNLNRDTFKQIAANLKMNVNDFLACYDAQKYAAEVQSDTQEANTLFSQASTPTIIIDDKVIQGAYPYNVFSAAIDTALNKPR